MLGVGDAKSTRKLKQVEATLCQIDRGVSQIDAGVISAGFGELRAVSPESATQFQHGQVFRLIESGGCGNVPLFSIAMFFDQFVELARPRRCVGKLRPAGIVLPEHTHAFFQYRVAFRHDSNNARNACVNEASRSGGVAETNGVSTALAPQSQPCWAKPP